MTTDDTRAAEMAAAFKPLAEMGSWCECPREGGIDHAAIAAIIGDAKMRCMNCNKMIRPIDKAEGTKQ